MREINLLPPEIAQRRRTHQTTVFLVASGMALVAILALVYLIQAARLGGERDRLQDVRASNAQLQRQINGLQSFSELQVQLRNKEQLLGRLTTNEVRWSLLLNNISLVIPSDVWLTNFSGSVQAPPAGAAAATTSFGTIQVSGATFTHLDVATWLARLARVDEFTFPYLSLSAKTAGETQTLVNFNSSVTLSDQALRRNQPGGVRRLP